MLQERTLFPFNGRFISLSIALSCCTVQTCKFFPESLLDPPSFLSGVLPLAVLALFNAGLSSSCLSAGRLPFPSSGVEAAAAATTLPLLSFAFCSVLPFSFFSVSARIRMLVESVLISCSSEGNRGNMKNSYLP
jgi:hypothetical protein